MSVAAKITQALDDLPVTADGIADKFSDLDIRGIPLTTASNCIARYLRATLDDPQAYLVVDGDEVHVRTSEGSALVSLETPHVLFGVAMDGGRYPDLEDRNEPPDDELLMEDWHAPEFADVV